MLEKQIEHKKKKKIKIKTNLGINTCKSVLAPTLCLPYVILLLLWGWNGTIALFIEIYINRPLFRKYLGIYHFLDTRVWGTWVPWTRIPWKNFENFLWCSSSIKIFLANLKIIFSKNPSLWNLSIMENSSSSNSSIQKVVDPYIFPK